MKGDGGLEDVEDDEHWFCSEAQALPVVVESLDVFAGHLTSKVIFVVAFIYADFYWCVFLPSACVPFFASAYFARVLVSFFYLVWTVCFSCTLRCTRSCVGFTVVVFGYPYASTR